MIVRVWGVVNSQEIEFTESNRPDYWEGYATRQEGLQDIEIWAENDKGARGHLQCSVAITYATSTTVRLLLCPYIVELLSFESGNCGCGCRYS